MSSSLLPPSQNSTRLKGTRVKTDQSWEKQLKINSPSRSFLSVSATKLLWSFPPSQSWLMYINCVYYCFLVGSGLFPLPNFGVSFDGLLHQNDPDVFKECFLIFFCNIFFAECRHGCISVTVTDIKCGFLKLGITLGIVSANWFLVFKKCPLVFE